MANAFAIRFSEMAKPVAKASLRQSVIMLNVVAPSVVVLNVIVLNAVVPSIVVLNVVVPFAISLQRNGISAAFAYGECRVSLYRVALC